MHQKIVQIHLPERSFAHNNSEAVSTLPVIHTIGIFLFTLIPAQLNCIFDAYLNGK